MAGRHPAPAGARNRTFKVTEMEYAHLKSQLSIYRKYMLPTEIEIVELQDEIKTLKALLEKKKKKI